MLKQITLTAIAVPAVLAVTAGTASAHECINASKQNQAAGVQIVISDDGIEWISDGLQRRIDKGLVDLETGEGFHGLIGFDIDGDGVADLSTWIVGPTGEIPDAAQDNGAECEGIVDVEYYFTNCVEA